MATSTPAILEIPVFFSEQMVAPDQLVSATAHKSSAVVKDWIEHRFPLDIVEPPPVAFEQLALAHSMKFIEDILALRLENGFGNRDPEVAATLPYTSGAMLAAARAALGNGHVAVAPVSGFHHAGYDEAGGSCTFNGLMVAARVLKSEGAVHRVGILDFDLHDGNGTDDIIRTLNADWVRHTSIGRMWRCRSQAVEFLEAIPEMVAEMADCGVILYQASADPHVEDPCGGWLTTEQLAERDRRVFAAAAERGVPIAWNLAGGYQRSVLGSLEPLLEIHRNTMFACYETFLCGPQDYPPDVPLVAMSELVCDPNKPLTYAQQRDLLRRINLHTRLTGRKVIFPDLERLPIDPVLLALEPRRPLDH